MTYASNFSFPRHGRGARRGVSILEVLGCLLAIVVGVWAGAAYFGVDLMSLLRLGMEKVGVASPQEAEDEAAPPTDAPAESEAKNSPAAKKDAEKAPPSGPQSPGEATLAYWNRLREVILDEQQTRANGEREAGHNFRAVLHAHTDAYTLAAQYIRQIPSKSVDAEAMQLAEEIAQWYDRGAELAEEGSTLLDEGELSSAQGPLGRRWHMAQRQHREELDLLSRKCSSVRGKLTARYRLRFVELQ